MKAFFVDTLDALTGERVSRHASEEMAAIRLACLDGEVFDASFSGGPLQISAQAKDRDFQGSFLL